VRARATLVAAAVVGAVLAVGGVAAQQALHASLESGQRTAAQTRAGALADQIARGGDLLTLVDLDDGDELVQVVDAAGRVRAASASARGLPALDGSGARVRVQDADDDDPEPYALATARVDDDAPQLANGVVVVGRALDDVEDVSVAVTAGLAVGLPVLLGVVAGVTWWLVGRALRPVDRMREQADRISHTSLAERLPEPGGDDEVARLARTLNAMLARLDDAARAQRRFVSDASHELRSPLAVVRQNAELVLGYPDRVDPAELAHGTLAEAERMQHLVDGLLLLARSDEGRLRRGPGGPVDLDDVLLAEAARLRSGTDLRVDTSGVAAVAVTGERPLLDRAVRNLVDNAARHASGRVALAVHASPDGRTAVLDVDDDGAGVPPADRDRVLERFVRLDDARARDAGGSGLGLAIVREVVAAHEGSVQVLDAPGGGARFRLLLPVADAG
jgi:signal transduction histidine kinase